MAYAGYASRNFSSLQKAVYGARRSSAVSPRDAEDGARIATGLGLTEASGFCTYTRWVARTKWKASGLGYAGLPPVGT